MPSFRVGVVSRDPRDARRAAARRSSTSAAGPERAYVLTQLTGAGRGRRSRRREHHRRRARARHRRLARRALEPRARRRGAQPGAGHGMKLRYTSLQVDVGADRSRRSSRRPRRACPVVVAGLHSQVAAIAVAFKHAPARRRGSSYVMTDGGALPIAISDLVWRAARAGPRRRDRHVRARVRRRLRSGLGARRARDRPPRRRGADAVVVAMGPGSAGTGDPARVQRHRGRTRARRGRRARRHARSRRCARRSPIRGRATAACRTTA